MAGSRLATAASSSPAAHAKTVQVVLLVHMEAAPAWVALVSVRALAQELMALGTVPIEAEGTQARADTRRGGTGGGAENGDGGAVGVGAQVENKVSAIAQLILVRVATAVELEIGTGAADVGS
ncbi:hypothetical protein CTheo_1475 [Ceratobasidium theobromae]|uniref:Uncharacterized protein n=1 Tax=Ceratobasidium theobromae TaxID=1582974 RepID=A0A5N5QTJ7_9AGAM|nr:hypothetical protein CTheo_1475 [Ceratobasidium theobromae]